jgi:hypothetical protein
MTISRRLLAAIVLVALLAVPACREASTEEAEGYEPSTLEPIEGSDALRVILTSEAAERIQLETAAVAAGADGSVVPEAAIWIDVEGREWVYTSPEPLTYVRAEVHVERYVDGTAVLSQGPPTGTMVVSVGVAELIGSEFGI